MSAATRSRRAPATAALLLSLLLGGRASAESVRVSDLVDVGGVRSNPLRGTGLVVGLNGTGDQSKATRQAYANVLNRALLRVDPRDLNTKNVALVEVMATLPPFARGGSRIDALVSSTGDATSLQGGTLMFTELYGADGEVYAVAQGALVVGGYIAAGQAASVQKNHPTVGRIPNGALVEREVAMRPLSPSNTVDLTLRSPGFVTARRLADAINGRFAASAATIDGGTVRVRLPAGVPPAESTGFIAEILSLSIEPEEIARVVVNARTGTVVAGGNVVIRPVAITHGNLSFSITEAPEVSQPAPLSDGTTVVVPRTDVSTHEEQKALVVVPGGASVKEVAEVLNSLGVTPRDLIEILSALKEAGALHAELVSL
jgi:flagellar P-ring protein precursor FlgI